MVAFEIGDLVWAKMKSFPPWPAKISEPDEKVKPPKVKEPVYYVYFFGTENYAWITESNIHSFEEGKTKFGQKNASKIKKAIQDMYEYAAKNPPKRKIIPTAKANGIASLKPQSKQQSSTSKEKIQHPTSSIKRISKPSSKIEVKKRRILDNYCSPSVSTSDFTTSSAKSKTSSDENSFYHFYKDDSDDSGGEEKEKSVKKQITPTKKKIGFLYYDNVVGSAMIKNLLHTKHSVSIWTNSDRLIKFNEPDFDLTVKHSIAEIVKSCDVIFSCLKDSAEVKMVFYGNNGLNAALSDNDGKDFIQMSPIDPILSKTLEEAIKLRKGQYLELQFLGNKMLAEEGLLTLLAAGDESLVKKYESCFYAIGNYICYLGPSVEKAVKMNALINIITGSCYAAVAEAMTLAEHSGISLSQVVDVFAYSDLKCPLIKEGGNSIANNKHNSRNLPLQHIQKLLHLALDIGEECQLPLPTTSASHEVFKRAGQLGYKHHDASAVYMSCRF